MSQQPCFGQDSSSSSAVFMNAGHLQQAKQACCVCSSFLAAAVASMPAEEGAWRACLASSSCMHANHAFPGAGLQVWMEFPLT